MDKQKNDGKLIVSVLMVCFAVAIGVMIFALCRPNDKKSAEFTQPPFESTAQYGKPEVSENLRCAETSLWKAIRQWYILQISRATMPG